MSDKQNSTLEEEREPLSKSWIFAGIVLFPLVPVLHMHIDKHQTRKQNKQYLKISSFSSLYVYLNISAQKVFKNDNIFDIMQKN